MAKRQQFIVQTNPKRGGWDLTKPNADRAVAHFETKAEAVEVGREKARAAEPGQLIIKGRNGRIQTEHTYGSDPERYPG